MDEINAYLGAIEQKLSGTTQSPAEEFAKGNYEYAQLLAAVGRFDEALTYFRTAFTLMESSKNSPIWQLMYCSIGLQYATILDYKGQINDAGDVFEELMRVDPRGIHIGDYALFLHRRKKRFDAAEELYVEALELFPNHSSIHLKYAGFLRHVRKDLMNAERHYQEAIRISPDNGDALGSYASFLHGVRNQLDQAEVYYKRAIQADNTHTNNLCNYGLFLSEERKDYREAEQLYKRALEIDENHTNTIYNFAVMLDTHLKKKQEAELLYRRAILIEPNHGYALYNLAVLLEERYSSALEEAELALRSSAFIADESPKLEILSLYQRASEADPKDDTTLADYGRFVYMRMDNPGKGEYLLETALQLNPDCEVALFHLSVIYQRKSDLKRSEATLRRLLQLSPVHMTGTLQLARLLTDVYLVRSKQKAETTATQYEAITLEVCFLYERYMELIGDPSAVVAEYVSLIERLTTKQQKMRVISSMEKYTRSHAVLRKAVEKLKSTM